MKLVIIGNGFDKSHELKTGYKDFKEYIKKHDDDEYEFLETLFGENFYDDDFWWNFEKNLSKFNFDNFAEELELNNDFKMKNGLEEDDIKESNSIYFKEHIYKLKSIFCRWIKTIDDNKIPFIRKKENLTRYFEDSIVLSFNYTSTIEEYYKDECYHIHGWIKNVNVEDNIGVDSIILGHMFDVSFADEHEDIISGDDAFFLTDDGEEISLYDSTFVKEYDSSSEDGVNEALSNADSNFETIFTKRCSSIVKKDETCFFEMLNEKSQDINEIIILGHSLADVDKYYFRKIIEILNNSPKYFISYYYDKKTGCDNKKDLLDNLKMIDDNASVTFISMDEKNQFDS